MSINSALTRTEFGHLLLDLHFGSRIKAGLDVKVGLASLADGHLDRAGLLEVSCASNREAPALDSAASHRRPHRLDACATSRQNWPHME